MKIVGIMAVLVSWIFIIPPVSAELIESVDVERVAVCLPQKNIISIPDFRSTACTASSVIEVNPQGKEIWIGASIEIPKSLLSRQEPLGITITGSAASAIFVNGELIGRNGVPGDSKKTEIPGRMDAVIYLPPGHLRSGTNQISAHLSSFHGHLILDGPIHNISVGLYRNPSEKLLHQYWPSFAAFGLFLVGWIYFGATALRSEDRKETVLLSLMSFFAAAQLIAEVWRGVSGYLYPYHELRLMLIASLSFAFGLCLATYILNRFAASYHKTKVSILALTTISAMLIVKGFDAKAAVALLIPASISAAGCAIWISKKKPHAAQYFIALIAFSLLIIFDPSHFLNGIFYYAVAGLLLFLFYNQAQTLIEEKERLKIEEERAKRLEFALEGALKRKHSHNIKITHSGKVEIISSENISHCSGAGDYVEICLKDGGTKLYGGSLVELEASLPPEFLRVHRSYIINTSLIISLKREPSGVGMLELAGANFVPVSRRTMPKVRNALD